MNKRTHYIAFLLMLTGIFFVQSCKKDDQFDGQVSSVLLFNAMHDGTRLYAIPRDYRPPVIEKSLLLSNKSYDRNYRIFVNEPAVHFSIYTSEDTLLPDAPMLRWKQPIEQASANTLFFAGTTADPKFVFTKDEFPRIYNDSVAYIRFVNLSDVPSLSINIKDKANGSLVASLDFKAVTAFLRFNVKPDLSSYVFECRDINSGQIFTSFSTEDMLNSWSEFEPLRFFQKHTSIVICGKEGSLAPNQPRMVALHHQIL